MDEIDLAIMVNWLGLVLNCGVLLSFLTPRGPPLCCVLFCLPYLLAGVSGRFCLLFTSASVAGPYLGTSRLS